MPFALVSGKRHLTTIKAVDEKCLELSGSIQQDVNALLLMPCQSALPHGPTEEYIELSKKVAQDQRMLLQFADEKVLVGRT